MSVIIVDLNTFECGYTVYHNEERYKCGSLEDIANFVPDFCFNHNIEKVLISGLPEQANKVATKIYRSNAMKYSENNLEIEVI